MDEKWQPDHSFSREESYVWCACAGSGFLSPESGNAALEVPLLPLTLTLLTHTGTESSIGHGESAAATSCGCATPFPQTPDPVKTGEGAMSSWRTDLTKEYQWPGFSWDRVNYSLQLAHYCFGFRMKILLISHWCFNCCSTAAQGPAGPCSAGGEQFYCASLGFLGVYSSLSFCYPLFVIIFNVVIIVI